MSSLLSAELSATCNALGTYDKKAGRYLVDDFTLNTVKDLIRYLRRDGEDHEIRRHFGQTKVLQTDLLPMLIDHWEKDDLFDVTLRLLVNLTNPALLLYREEVPVERTARHNYLQILSHLQAYKEEAFTKIENWTVFAKKLAKVLEIDWSERDEDTGLIIERILILIRNILHVPADLDKERRPENDASVHDQVLWALNQSGILDILLYMSSENEKQYFMHILEIISHLLREQNPSSLADAALQRSVDEKLKDEQELLTIRLTENKQRMNKIKQYSGVRHSRFGGTYVIQNMKSISENEMITLKPLNKISNLDFSGGKKSQLTKPKNRRPVESGILERRSAFAIRLFLKEFCIEFLNSAYNPLMHYVKDVLVRAKAQQNDESYYLWAVKFFMEFNRGHNFQVGLVSETMSVPMFHYVQQQMEKYYDMIKMEKKKFAVWVRRLHLALRAYKELLNTLLAMDKSNDQTVKDSAKVLKSNIFYVLEYREFILTTFLNYDENRMPRSYLVDLIETVHLFLKMLEHYCKKTGLVVQKKVKKKTKSKKSKKPTVKAKPVSVPQWEEVRSNLCAVMSASVDRHPPPFDAASDVPVDQQREDCMKKIQRLMREYKFEDAVGMFRAAREVWPEEGIFGVSGIQEDEELNMLETIYSTDLGVEVSDTAAETNENENSEYEDDEEEEDERTTAIVETDFSFEDFVYRFCHPRVVSSCVYLLQNYDKNSPHTNHCIIKMLHRIAWDCKLPSMMFQASLFLIFQRLLNDSYPQFKELEKFAVFITRKFTEIAAGNPKVFIELLFYKSSRDASEIESGYNLYSDTRNNSGKGAAWSVEQEAELHRLYMENQSNPQTDQDVIDWILDNLIDQTRTRRSVIKKLKELGLIFKAPTKRSNKERKDRDEIPKEFTEEEDELLRDLWEMYNSTADPLSIIIPRMPRKRSKKSYIERLLQLGLIKDRKECHKKTKKSKTKDASSLDDKSDDSDLVSSNSDSDGRASPAPTHKVNKKKKQSQANKRSNEAPTLSANQIARLLVQAVDNGFTNQLKWLAENLEEVALDQEAEGFDPTAEGIALVPLTIDCIEAMDNDLFKKLLRGIGVVPPFDEQETYWRIPSSLHFDTIRKRREIIIKAVNKELIIDATESTPTDDVTTRSDDEDKARSSDDDDLFDNLRKLRENNIDNNVINKSDNSNLSRKRSCSNDSHDETVRGKMQRIDERDENSDDGNDSLKNDDQNQINGRDDDDDILSFAKRTLHYEEKARSSDDDDLFDNLRKLRENNIDNNVINKSDNSNLSRKRSRSNDSHDETVRGKMQRIDEHDENSDDGNDSLKNDDQNQINGRNDDDILSFAKRTLQQEDLPDTEDILSNIPNALQDDSDDETDLPVKQTKKKRRAIIEDDSD